jgi:hypothetical protein
MTTKYVFDEKNFICRMWLVVAFNLLFATTRILVTNVAYDLKSSHKQ